MCFRIFRIRIFHVTGSLKSLPYNVPWLESLAQVVFSTLWDIDVWGITLEAFTAEKLWFHINTMYGTYPLIAVISTFERFFSYFTAVISYWTWHTEWGKGNYKLGVRIHIRSYDILTFCKRTSCTKSLSVTRNQTHKTIAKWLHKFRWGFLSRYTIRV